MIWLEERWLSERPQLGWPLYDWLRARHLAAAGALGQAQAARAAVEARHATEDREIHRRTEAAVGEQREAIAAALRAGYEPPREPDPVEEAPATGPVRRQLELQAADEEITAAETDVHRIAWRILWTLPQYLYELEEAKELALARARVEYIATESRRRKKERALRERFHRESFAAPGPGQRCDHCSLESSDLHDPAEAWFGSPERKSIEHVAGALRTSLVGADPGVALNGVRVAPYPFADELSRIASACPSALLVKGRPPVVERRPEGAPAVEQILDLSEGEREDLFRARFADPTPDPLPVEAAAA